MPQILSTLLAAVLIGTGWFGMQAQTQNPESKLLSNSRQLILSGKRSGEGYFGSQGRYMIFQSERDPENPFFQMYLLDFKSGDLKKVSPGHGKTTCGWVHPDQKHLMFSSTHADPQAREKQQQELALRASGQQKRYSWDYDPQYEIYETSIDGTQPINLSKTLGYDAEGAYSPDGKQIVFASNRSAYQHTLSQTDAERLKIDPAYFMELYIMNRDGSNVRQLTHVKGYDGGPFFSPDGQRIVFRRFNEAGDKAEIYTMKLDGSDQRQITHLGVMSWAPFYHPSGEYLIFATNKHGFGNFELYIVDTDGQQEPVRVTYTEGFDGLPAFSPDGNQLAWTSSRTSDKKSQLFLSDWNHTQARYALALDKREIDTATLVPARVDEADLKTEAGISAQDIEKRVRYLSSDQMAGRMTGSPGEEMATRYAADIFKQLGLTPAGDKGSYFQHFQFTAGVELGSKNELSADKTTLKLSQDWQPLIFSASGDFAPAEMVFAGYGLKAPESKDFGGYDSYYHLDVKDKWVVVLRYWPENTDENTLRELKRYAGLRYKAMIARDNGAKGLIVVSGPQSPDKKDLIPFQSQTAPGTVSIPALSLSNATMNRWFQESGQSLSALQTELDQGKMVQGFSLKPKLGGKIDLKKIEKTGRNVLARLDVQGATKTVVLGAHLDHLGQGHHGNSLARGDQAGKIHPGADDNASGSAGVLEIAESLAQASDQKNLKQNVLFALWSGEEIGLLGSNYFVEQFSKEEFPEKFSAYLNMDMIGRLDKALVVQGVGSSAVWNDLLEQNNLLLGLPLVLQNTAYLPTDSTSFYIKGIPALSTFTGAHSDYHTPGDTADKLNYPGAAQIIRLVERLTRDLASREHAPDYQKQDPPKQGSGRGLRIYLGTIPDYASGDLKGVKLSGVSNGGPAAKAGIQAGDIIVALNGKTIENIYDYTYALDSLKIGVVTHIVVLRNGKKLTLSLTPGSRN